MSIFAAMALSGINSDSWSQDLKPFYDQSIQILKIKRYEFSETERTSPDGASSSSSSTSSIYQDSAVIATRCTKKYAFNDFEIDLKDEMNIRTCPSGRSSAELTDRNTPPTIEIPNTKKKPDEISIMYQNRDILDLSSNLRGQFVVYSTIPPGVNSYFQNRSQISRLNDVYPPVHTMVPCPEDDCDFLEPRYQ